MKETCNRCVALQMLSNSSPRCLLGYKVDRTKVKPLEACEKPLTYQSLISLHKFEQVGKEGQ